MSFIGSSRVRLSQTSPADFTWVALLSPSQVGGSTQGSPSDCRVGSAKLIRSHSLIAIMVGHPWVDIRFGWARRIKEEIRIEVIWIRVLHAPRKKGLSG
jgi:hypothetical protein